MKTDKRAVENPVETVLETKRLYLREMNMADFPLLSTMLQDIEVMYAWEHAFSDREVVEWIERNIARYRRDGCGYWLAFERETGRGVGQIGLIREAVFGVSHFGIGWMLARRYWGRGYATEAAAAAMEYAFDELGAPRVIADIRPANHSSIRVAERIGMRVQGSYDKIYNHRTMRHLLYVRRTPRVEVVEYRPGWREQFAELEKLLAPLTARFGGVVEHVGSTAVPGLAAKPVIDADYIPADFSFWPAIRDELETLGFYHRGDGGLPGREMFTESLRLPFRHNFYVCHPDSIHLTNHRKLRDYLRSHPEEARRYGALKRQLAAQFPADIDGYCAAKSGLLAELLLAAGVSGESVAKIRALNCGGGTAAGK